MRYAAILLACLMTAPVIAEDAVPAPVQEGANLKFDAVGHSFTLPLPDWLTSAERLSPDVLGLVETNAYADPNQAFVEFFPKGQSIENYSTTYAARITREAGRSLDDYRRATIFGYSQSCKPEATGVFTFGETTDDFFPALGFICGAFRDDIDTLRGQGQVMVSVFMKTDVGIAMVYQEWRGPAFNPSDPATWPVSGDAYQARADELKAASTVAASAD
jgi:hypothetical protein